MDELTDGDLERELKHSILQQTYSRETYALYESYKQEAYRRGRPDLVLKADKYAKDYWSKSAELGSRLGGSHASR